MLVWFSQKNGERGFRRKPDEAENETNFSFVYTNLDLRNIIKSQAGAVAERLRYRSHEQKVPSSSPRSDISVEMTSQC